MVARTSFMCCKSFLKPYLYYARYNIMYPHSTAIKDFVSKYLRSLENFWNKISYILCNGGPSTFTATVCPLVIFKLIFLNNTRVISVNYLDKSNLCISVLVYFITIIIIIGSKVKLFYTNYKIYSDNYRELL